LRPAAGSEYQQRFPICLLADCYPVIVIDSCDLSVETVLLKDDILRYMANGSSIKNLLLLVLAVIIVIALWRTLWWLAGVAVFIFVVYIVYEMLKGRF